MKKTQKRHIAVLLILLIPFILLGISNYFFASSSYVLDSTGTRQWAGNPDGLFMALAISVSLFALWIAGLYTGHLDKCIESITTAYKNMINAIKENPKKIRLHAAILLSIVLLAVIVEFLFSRYAPFQSFSMYSALIRILFYMTAGLSVYFIAVLHKKPEILFLFLSLLIGFLYIAAYPFIWYGWDCGVHYAWAVEQSFIWNVSVSRADFLMANTPEFYPFHLYAADHELAGGISGLLESRQDAVLYTFRKGTGTFAWSGFTNIHLYERLAHIPTGLMIFIGRSLTLPPILILKLGTVVNHLIYTLLVYFALRRLNSGKYLMAVIAMFPTSFVLSTTYGYDHWVTGFLLLGFAYYIYEAQNPEKKIEPKNMIIMITAFIIGIIPKAAYAPMILILYFIKKDKFNTAKERKIYLAAVTASILLVLASFAVPFLAAGGGEGDWRGGSDVNGARQLMFVLQNPITFIMIFFRFLISYLNIFTQNYITYFAHLGNSSFYHPILLLLGFVMITDRNENDIPTSAARYKIPVAAVGLATIALFSLAMYIGFTEVGADTIAGVQGRYMIPILFPLLYVLGNFKIQNKINKTAYNCSVFGIMSFVLLTGAWEKFILHT